ncbi:serine hydrolase [Actinorhabdospora filicis]|uniref:Serine hydrolase n=1 Tax=Actinorhabdospora filicis TaxID=1785913 RepID=A0A9W6WB08_9ACTN|nr:serine hydrolase [Actinorhabdospora filicis]GLZ78230.1 serine hydrolase [Actinorhabdospora filicis]
MPALTAPFDRIGARAVLHAVDLGSGAGTGVGADEPVILASVVKVLIALEFARQADAGQLDPADRVRVRAGDRLGGTGVSGFDDDVELSLRDLARLMMSVSDNTAADLLTERVGTANLRSLAAELALEHTRIVGPPRAVVAAMSAELGDLGDAGLLLETAAYDPARTNSSTPADCTRLLAAIWADRAGSPAACGYVRRLMAGQADWHRIASGFGDDAEVAAKSGTLPGLRNEIGVVALPDGGRYAVAVFARLPVPHGRRLDADAAIGRAARAAVDALRHSP